MKGLLREAFCSFFEHTKSVRVVVNSTMKSILPFEGRPGLLVDEIDPNR